MNSRQLIHWSTLHDRRAHQRWWRSRYAIATIAGGLIAAWVAWRAEGGFVSASHAWLAAAAVTFAIAFLRVPFHLYWRRDANLLAQLPIDGGPLFDAALLRCLRAATATTFAALIGAAPIAFQSIDNAFELYAHHAVVAVVLGISAGALIPAVATWAAAIVAIGQGHARVRQVRALAGIAPEAPGTGHSSALLGALPGFAGTVVIVGVVLVAPWLIGDTPVLPAPAILGTLGGLGVISLPLVRRTAKKVMGTILRDVSALDRQTLATLEIRKPTVIEHTIAVFLGSGALPYKKTARLVRRRYPMAFALGALSFLVLVVVAIAQPDDPGPWLTATFAGAAAYGVVLGRRLGLPPIDLPRLSHTLPISNSARARANVAWIVGWWTMFVALPGAAAIARQPYSLAPIALLGAATVIVLGAALARRPT